MKKVRVIQIGVGHDHATDVLDSMVSLKQNFEVVAFAVPEEEKTKFSEKIRLYTKTIGVKQVSMEEALNLKDIDGAVIETEEANLCKYAYLAAQKGLHIHMDKPGSAVYEEFAKLIELLKKKKLVLSMGYMYRFNPEMKKVIREAEYGNLGNIYSVEAHMNCEHTLDKRRWLANLPGGMMFFLGCHLIDFVYRLKGEPMEIVPFNTCMDQEKIGADDFGMAVFKYQDGASLIKVCAAECGGFLRRQIVICAEKGTIEIRPIERWLTNRIFSFNGCTERKNMSSSVRNILEIGNWHSDAQFKESEPFNRYDDMMCNFAERINGKEEPVYTYDYELSLYSLILKACARR